MFMLAVTHEVGESQIKCFASWLQHIVILWSSLLIDVGFGVTLAEGLSERLPSFGGVVVRSVVCQAESPPYVKKSPGHFGFFDRLRHDFLILELQRLASMEDASYNTSYGGGVLVLFYNALRVYGHGGTSTSS
eukprot:3612325-Rhodomonas_salina.1